MFKKLIKILPIIGFITALVGLVITIIYWGAFIKDTFSTLTLLSFIFMTTTYLIIKFSKNKNKASKLVIVALAIISIMLVVSSWIALVYSYL
jgi:hypothetical protein